MERYLEAAIILIATLIAAALVAILLLTHLPPAIGSILALIAGPLIGMTSIVILRKRGIYL